MKIGFGFVIGLVMAAFGLQCFGGTYYADSVCSEGGAPKGALAFAFGAGKENADFVGGGLELKEECGYVAFWFRPSFDACDGKRHLIFAMGVPGNGVYLEKSEKGLLRVVCVSGEKMAASRAAVDWKAGEWHHVAFGWFENLEGVPAGLPLFYDRVCVAGEIPCKEKFFDGGKIEGNVRFFAEIGEIRDLVIRNERWGSSTRLDGSAMPRMVYDDFFRTLPAEKIRINPWPWRIPSEERILVGRDKKFGLEAKVNGVFIPVTDEISAYSNWSDFDAKPYIAWGTDSGVADVPEQKKAAVRGVSEGKVRISATYRGCKASYDTEVIGIDRPDLSVQYVEMLPRYSYKWEKVRIAPGDMVTSIVHVANYGTVNSKAGEKLVFSLGNQPETNKLGQASLKHNLIREDFILPALAPMQRISVTNVWKCPNKPVYVAAEVSCKDDLCRVNNRVCDLNTARPLWFAFNPMVMTNYFNERLVNCVGSFSMSDWVTAHKKRLDLLLKETKYPDICPDGLKDTYRVDNLVYNYPELGEKNVYHLNEEFRDGGFPITDNPKDHASHQNSEPFFGSLNASVIHELGHTCLALPDVYGYPVREQNVLLKDEKGEYYVGSSRIPRFGEDIFYSSAENVPCGTAYTPLMSYCHMWINKANAGKIAYCSGYRGPRFWGVQGRLIPISENIIKVYDVFDRPLKDAAVYVYHVSHGKINSFADKYFTDCPKFKGYTDRSGRYAIPTETDRDWDGGYTDRFDGSVSVWNPFGMPTDELNATKDTASTPSVWHAEGLLLVKIETKGDVEFHLLPMTEFNEQFFAGDKFRGVYEIRTQLVGTERPELRKTVVPEACSKENKAPVPVLSEKVYKAKAGEEVTVDASESYDPEGQPLLYYWHDAGNWYATDFRKGPVQTYKAPAKPGEKIKKALYVLDGIRASELLEFEIEAE